MQWTIIKSEDDYAKALHRLDEIFEPTTDKEQDEFDLLVLLIKAYESAKYPIEEADPIQVVKMKMKYLNYDQKDLVKYVGSKSTVSKILSYKSPLTLKHVWILSRALQLPIELLAKPYNIDQWSFMKKFDKLEWEAS